MHRPLTRTPAPSLDFSRPGTPAARDFGDIYFSTDGGLAETRAVFLEGCGLPDGWRGRPVFTVAELGFGSGLNFLATWKAWRDSGAAGRLHYISVEGHPFERAELARALSAFPDLADLAAPLLDSWPGPVRGVHRRHFGAVTLTLVHDDVVSALAGQDFHADAWFLDGFSPAKNPDMWSQDVMAEVARLSAPGARLATFTVAGAVRLALGAAGFEVERKEGFGRKRHRLEARLPGSPSRCPSVRMPTIVGAGIAGASVARAFRRRGLSPTVLSDPDHVAASGNPAALVKPRLDLQDRSESRFFLSSFLYARAAYRGLVLQAGVTHRPKDDTQADRLRRIARNEPLGPGHLRWEAGALEINSAVVIDPEAVRRDFLAGCELQERRLFDPSEIDGPVILAAGYGIRDLWPKTAFRFSRGQLSWADGTLERALTYGGYAIGLDGRLLLGATHDRIVDHADAFELRPEDDARNTAQARDQGLDLGDPVTSCRASVRVNAPDTLPRLMRLESETGQEVWILSGLGSRGFVFGPLLGEALASAYLGEPSPLETGFAERISLCPN
ncbi:tRNA (5-methylaminomethyl-2-thiouridine)(34)-methyltransferase MnmD [uncultured Algimonas sp.]|uniref:tRNA (5-methylaminomethyl-2-thiouridine)(34)-methyltransferase MnmD n=1 Tax=uncultured Algimonas sp. TaxID=1547920 RepID=UPI00261EACBC|nr:tRNA (5-methylaminomethyl-2-thiouridine)(34)-methyltransferase MnmD [uncultured Algimonas sp.]